MLRTVYARRWFRDALQGLPALASLVAFVVACAALQGVWLLRWFELAILSHDEESRRYSALRLVDDLPSVLWWLGALALAITLTLNLTRTKAAQSERA